MMKQSDIQVGDSSDYDRTRIVFLTGLSGCGKSTISVELAHVMKRECIDTDERITERENRSIREIFETQGERRFREIETQVIQEIVENCTAEDANKYVVALGGGALMSQENVACVKKAGLLALLEVSCSVAAERLQGLYDRPLALDDKGKLLSVEKLSDRLARLLEDRSEGFSQADFVVNSGTNSIVTTCENIRSYVESLAL